MNIRFHRNALFLALLAIGVAGGTVHAQTSGSTSSGGMTSGSAAQKGSASSTTGMDKGAGPGATSGSAAKSGAKSADAKAGLSGSERRFIETAARGGMAEVQLGKMAQDKAQDTHVKDFGRRMVDDHGKANDQLKRIASTKGVTLPAETDDKHKRLSDRLGKMQGGEFDRSYMKEMVDDHKKDVKEFRDMAKNAKDPDIRSFASTNLPILEEHLKMAQATHAAMGKGGGTQSASARPASNASTMAGTTAAGMTPPGGAASGGASAGGTAPAGTAGAVTSGLNAGSSGSGTTTKNK